jgi:hypothetical protein
MRWRDIRFEKPTEADGDDCGQVLQLLSEGSVGSYHYANDCDCIAWMPLSELPAFDRVPDPPEGWRFVEKGEAFDKRAKFWGVSGKEWLKLNRDLVEYPRLLVCIVPIDPPAPPEPQYRPFANAAEFEPYELKFWRYKDDCKDLRRKPCSYSNDGHFGDQWCQSFDNKVFSDGTPCGVKVES